MSELTPRQRAVLEFIAETMQTRGYPPSVREIGEAVGLASSSSVHAQLATLQKLGYLRRDPTKPRAIEIRFDTASGSPAERRPTRYVPLVGEIAAGRPILATEAIEEAYPFPADWISDEGTVFMLDVKGDSMIDAGIFDGDRVIVRKQEDAPDGEIVAALIGGEEATVKRLQRRGGKIVLIPENAKMDEMVFEDGVEILGRVTTVIRSL